MNKLYNDILSILKEDARTTAADMAVMLNKPRAYVEKAVAALEKDGILKK